MVLKILATQGTRPGSAFSIALVNSYILNYEPTQRFSIWTDVSTYFPKSCRHKKNFQHFKASSSTPLWYFLLHSWNWSFKMRHYIAFYILPRSRNCMWLDLLLLVQKNIRRYMDIEPFNLLLVPVHSNIKMFSFRLKDRGRSVSTRSITTDPPWWWKTRESAATLSVTSGPRVTLGLHLHSPALHLGMTGNQGYFIKTLINQIHF